MACGRPLGWRKDVDGIGAREARARSQGVDCWDDVARVVKRRGVYKDKRASKWLSAWYHKSKTVYLGYFTSEAAAMRTYDRVALAPRPGAETNFPSSDYSEEELAHLRSLPLDDVVSKVKQHLLAGSPAGSASEGAPVLQPALPPAESLTGAWDLSAAAAAAASPDDPASLLGRCILRSFYPPGALTSCWYEGRVSSVRLELGGDGRSVVPAWEVVYDDGDREEMGWEDLQAVLTPVAKRARRERVMGVVRVETLRGQ